MVVPPAPKSRETARLSEKGRLSLPAPRRYTGPGRVALHAPVGPRTVQPAGYCSRNTLRSKNSGGPSKTPPIAARMRSNPC